MNCFKQIWKEGRKQEHTQVILMVYMTLYIAKNINLWHPVELTEKCEFEMFVNPKKMCKNKQKKTEKSLTLIDVQT